MQTALFVTYLMCICFASVIGVAKYKKMDIALQTIVILLLLTVLSELLSYILIELKEYGIRYGVYHIYNIVQLALLSIFFICAIKPKKHLRFILLSIISSIAIGTANMLFLQPIYKLNNFMLIFESFVVITLSLYYIYSLIKKDVSQNLFKQAHFFIALLLLIVWSSTLFFWSFLPVLFKNNWPYINAISHVHTVINIIVYTGIALVFLFYRQKQIITNGFS